ncbi:hypothetical protein FRAAL5958 [Frankia alni ACN14a]|uniref:Uncharacterized protein n=1 Tax=Frankia alni (strain DSM 45986 / CECT 9034 / ACN14a) TaxID=326424 RepID=Q0RD89_FRAAA|nr:hypothetical protein FRAAL5958 [Frankia alni ACN14a]
MGREHTKVTVRIGEAGECHVISSKFGHVCSIALGTRSRDVRIASPAAGWGPSVESMGDHPRCRSDPDHSAG